MKTTLTLALIVTVSLTLGFFIGSNLNTLLSRESPLQQESTLELSSPYDHVQEDSITLTPEGFFIALPERTLSWSRYSNTNSMDPLLDTGCNGLEFIPTSTEDIHVGDIIAYEDHGLVVHRVSEIGQDEEGWYAITKGDNNPYPDTTQQRFESIKYVTFGIIC